MKRVMWIEHKVGAGLSGPARIGWVSVSDKGKRLDYGDQSFRTLRGSGFKSNYYDIETHDKYWISGCRKDGRDALYGTTVEIDEDALEEYWVNIRNQPENKSVCRMSAAGKNR
ncbi:MAG TPA: hypothetical protein PKC65_10150 [Pyrinomonadaceae bacterium]|nr:hypothetical protein [Pyrinomonadaceae bacterium]